MKSSTSLLNSSLSAAWALVLGPALAWGQGTFQWTATFDGFPPIAPGDSLAIRQYFEGNMWFRSIGPLPSGPPYYFGRCGGGIDGFAYNATAYLHAGLGYSLAASAPSGARFGLVSVDLAEFSTYYQTPLTVLFVGYKPDGSTVSTEFVTDGIIDSFGSLPDFETFYFDTRFADLIRVEVPTYGWALDNLVFRNIPEPSVAALVLAGGLLLWSLRRRWSR